MSHLSNPNLEQRANVANEQHANIYISIHAGMLAHGVRLYTAALPSAQPPAGKFLPWESAQSAFLDRSKSIARIIENELHKTDLPVVSMAASLRPLNNITAPAIAVEVAPSQGELQGSSSQSFQSTVVFTLAGAIALARAQWEAHP